MAVYAQRHPAVFPVYPVPPPSYSKQPPPQPATFYAGKQPQQVAYVPADAHKQPLKPDPYYGHRDIAIICARFITHLFTCHDYPPSRTTTSFRLPNYIAYAIYRTKLDQSVVIGALILLQRLKAKFPSSKGTSGHRLFISSFMLSSKILCDDTYSNKSWAIVAQNLFHLREVNQMEREMTHYLAWNLNLSGQLIDTAAKFVLKDFIGTGPFPVYKLVRVKAKGEDNDKAPTSSPESDSRRRGSEHHDDWQVDHSPAQYTGSEEPIPSFEPENAQFPSDASSPTKATRSDSYSSTKPLVTVKTRIGATADRSDPHSASTYDYPKSMSPSDVPELTPDSASPSNKIFVPHTRFDHPDYHFLPLPDVHPSDPNFEKDMDADEDYDDDEDDDDRRRTSRPPPGGRQRLGERIHEGAIVKDLCVMPKTSQASTLGSTAKKTYASAAPAVW